MKHPFCSCDPPEHPEWRTLLQAIEHYGLGRAVIAGGAARDASMDMDPKDLDVFLPDPGHSLDYRANQIMAFCQANGATYEYGSNAAYFKGSDGILTTVHTITWPGLPYPVQLIGLYQGHEPWGRSFVVSRIDFGLCRIAFSLDGWLVDSHYITDRDFGKFTLVRCDSWEQFQQSMKRAWRLWDKYDLPVFVGSKALAPEMVRYVASDFPGHDDKSVVWIDHTTHYAYSPDAVHDLASRLGY